MTDSRPSFDLAVVGLGPAGRALASGAAVRGLRVLAVDPRPDARWGATYGLWGDELGDLPASVVSSRVIGPEVYALARHPLRREYLVLDNAALQAALPLEGVEVRRGRLSDAGVAALRGEARVVADARGARPDGAASDDPAPAQTAYGIVVPPEDAAPALQGAPGFLMDWRTDWSGTARPDGPPSFLYAIPLAEGVLLEETCLAAAPGLPIPELRERLRRRLLRRGVRPAVIDHPLAREVVRIPLRGRGRRPPTGTLAVGTAGRGGHLVTGYSVAHSLARAGVLADALAAGRTPKQADPPAPADLLRELGLRALLRLDTQGTLELFDAFGRLSAPAQRTFMARGSGAVGLGGAMAGMFARLSPPAKGRLLVASVGWPAPAASGG